MNSKDTLKIEEQKIRSQEPALLVAHTAEMQGYDSICRRMLSPADKIAHAIMHITSLYGQAFKNLRGGWTCVTHIIHVRTALSHTISAKYNNEDLMRFIDFCVRCTEGRDFLQNADNDIKDMAEDFLSMRPEPLVHPPASWWRQVLDGNNE